MATEATVSIGHDDLMLSLAEHLRRKSDRMVWCDMQLGPAGSPRPDVWTLNKSYANPKPLAYECKVSKSDFRSDVTKGKWQSYLKYSCAVIFAVPAGLITKDDLPQGCGLMTFNGIEWRTVKGPTLNVVGRGSLPQDALMKLLIDGVRREVAAQRMRLKDRWDAERAITKKFGEKVGRWISGEFNVDDRIEEMRRRYAEEEADERRRRARDLEDARREVDGIWAKLCDALVLPEGSSSWTVRDRLQIVLKAVDEAEEVRALKDVLRRIEDAVAQVKATPNQRVYSAKAE